MARKEARQIAMQLIYQYEMGGDGIASTIEETIEGPSLTTSDREYIDQVVLGAVERAQDLDARIAAHAQGWTLERIARVDLAILRLALFEMFYREDVPTGVAINEAVELAHAFSGGKAASFINGILGTIAREAEAAPWRSPPPGRSCPHCGGSSRCAGRARAGGPSGGRKGLRRGASRTWHGHKLLYDLGCRCRAGRACARERKAAACR